MRTLRRLAGPASLLTGAALVAACYSDAPPAGLALVMRAPQGLLDQATSVTLSVAESSASAKCVENGHAELPSSGVQSFALGQSGCAAGVSWCKDIELDKDGKKRVFFVAAKNAGGVVAEGCAEKAVDQDPLEVTIKMERFNPPACCGDGMLQSGEQCECGVGTTVCQGASGCSSIGADAVCGADCSALEIAVDHTTNTPAPGDKARVRMAFCPGDSNLANALRVVWDDATSNSGDVGIRLLDDKLYPIPMGSPLAQPRFLPLLCSALTAKGPARTQQDAQIAPISSDLTAVVYASNEITGAHNDIYLSPQSNLGCRDKLGNDPPAVQVSTTGNDATAPDVAGGPNGSGLVVWTENNQVHGRIFTEAASSSPPWTLSPAQDIVIAQTGGSARVAGSAAGWIVVYQGSGTGDGDGVFAVTIDPNGIPGVTTKVNAATEGLQEQPDIARLPDGRYAVVWRSGGDVYAQRFSSTGTAVAGDQDAPIHEVTTGDQSHPAVAGFGNLFTVVWESDGGVWGRYLGADGGFLYNSVNGQNSEFDAGQPGVTGERHLPSVAVGGAGFVAIGWEDRSAGHPGIFVRRFPLPAQ